MSHGEEKVEKQNLLLRTEGEAKWKYEIETAEKMVLGNQCHIPRPMREVAMEVQETNNHVELPRITAWALPKNFCCKCEKNDVTPGIGLDGAPRSQSYGQWILDVPMPGLDVTVGDVIVYFLCDSCAYKTKWGEDAPGVLVGANGEPLVDPREVYKKRVTDYLYSMKLKGESPKEIGSV